jgi:hypothetical protein
MGILGITGPTEAENAATETSQSKVRVEVAKKIALGSGVSVGGAIVFGAFELLHNDSRDAFPLLKSWGPWAIFSIVAVYFAYDILKIVLNMALRAVIAMEQSALAQQRLADKDDRQLQELETLTSFAAQESERNSARIKELMAAQTVLATTTEEVLQIVRRQQPVDVSRVVNETMAAYKRNELREG